MSYGVRQNKVSKKWEVFKRSTKRLWATHSTKAEAVKQQGILNRAVGEGQNRRKRVVKKKRK